MNMNNEPIRLPAWCFAVLAVILPPIIAYLSGADWKIALATALGGLIPASATVAVAESKRAFTYSPETQQRLALGAEELHAIGVEESDG